MKKLLTLLLLASIGFASCKTTSEAVSLKLQMPKGNIYDYTMVMDMDMNQEMMGQKMEMENKITYAYVFEVLSDSAEWKTIRSTIGRMRMDIKAMGNSVSVDTDNPADSAGMMAPVYKMFAGMKGQQFSFTINDKGEVGRIIGLKELRDAMLKELPQGLEKQMDGTMDEESFRQNLEQSFNIFPAKDVAIGESWTKTSNMKTQGMEIKTENTYTLESVGEGTAVIKVKQKLSSGKTPTGEAEVTMDGTGDGTYTYEQATGMVLGGDLKMKMNMEVLSQGRKMPMAIGMDISIKGKKR